MDAPLWVINAARGLYGEACAEQPPTHHGPSLSPETIAVMRQADLFSRGRRRRVHATLPGDREDVREQQAKKGEPRLMRARTHRSQDFQDVSYDGVIAADLLSGGGWCITRVSMGGPVGRPKEGLRGDLLEATVKRDLSYTIAELRECSRMQLRTERWSGMYDHLCVFVYVRNVNRQAGATAFGCHPKTIDRMRKKGLKMTEQLDRIEGKLDKLLKRLKQSHPTSEEITATVDALIEDVYAEAA